MAFHSRSQVVNPRLGVYFGIFAATLVGCVVMLLIFEQLGTSSTLLRYSLLFAAIGLFSLIGIVAFTSNPPDFLFAGRRVPASFAGPSTAIAAIGGTGLAAVTGALFLIGFDALVLPLGLMAGFVVSAIVIAPYFRKFGTATLPGFLGDRFDSHAVRLAAAAVAAMPLLLLLVAEIKTAAFAVTWLTQGSERTAVWIVTIALITILVPGGVRSQSWSSAAQTLAALLAILVPAAVIAVIETNLPIGQLSHGPVLRSIGRIEAANGITSPLAPLLYFDSPGQSLQPVAGRFATPFSSIGAVAFVLSILAIMAGTAASPALLARSSTAPTVYEARKSMGWTVLVAGVLIMTMSALAVFLREKLMTEFLGQPAERLGEQLKPLIDLGLAGLDGQSRPGSLASIQFRRDGVLLGLPTLMRFPGVLVHLIAIGLVAAALAAAGSALLQLGLIIGEDVVNAPRSELKSSAMRLHVARGAVVVCALLAGLLAATLPGDPLELVFWSLAISGATLFPVLLLGIWWKRTNAWGTLAGLATGLAIVIAGLLANAADAIALSPILLPPLAAPIAIATAIVASKLTPIPSRHELEMVRELRVPGGETIRDREARLNLQRDRQHRNA